MATFCKLIFTSIVVVFATYGERSKRLVLHSETDIFHELQMLKQRVTELENRGSLYTRWGRTVCQTNGTEKVYSGYAAGQPYDRNGGPSNWLCLPEHPSWLRYIDGLQREGAYIAGAEYEPGNNFNPFPNPMRNQDVPCAVCRTTIRTSTLMVPGKTDCYPGWTKEYMGYLMAGHSSQVGATNYICVDGEPEAVLHGEADLNGKLLYVTEVKCGSLPCQEYPEGRELACVVCTK